MSPTILNRRWRSFRPGPSKAPRRQAALAAIDDLLCFIDNHYTGTGPTAYEHLDFLGGAAGVIDIVERGLKHRDSQVEFRAGRSVNPEASSR
jgi:hypothetical protein